MYNTSFLKLTTDTPSIPNIPDTPSTPCTLNSRCISRCPRYPVYLTNTVTAMVLPIPTDPARGTLASNRFAEQATDHPVHGSVFSACSLVPLFSLRHPLLVDVFLRCRKVVPSRRAVRPYNVSSSSTAGTLTRLARLGARSVVRVQARSVVGGGFWLASSFLRSGLH